ncbi:hypothetical protein Daesc_002480 [Daldinia eschscholtzii]|uniref:GED domain-containing protein n=1 Tax=Daldinia eschscholtzii TaxID=292717 RepID=A0AAX6MXG5_9PEZI
MNVNSHLFRTYRESQLDEFLNSKFYIFGQSDPGLYERLMEEDMNTAKRREQLKAEMDKLVRAMHSINNLERSSNDSSFRPTYVNSVNSDSEMDDVV